MPTRLNVNINDVTAAAIRDLSSRRDITATEVIRRAVAVYAFVEGEIAAGKTLQTRDTTTGEITTVTLL